MLDNCRLCLREKTLKKSHIVPKLFYKILKERSPVRNTRIRYSLEPNKPLQDGEKRPFLCEECEIKLSKYETYFSKNYSDLLSKNSNILFKTDSDELRYFILSVAWRILQNDRENGLKKNINGGLSDNEIARHHQETENWRKFLCDANYDSIRKVQMHMIPTNALSIFDSKVPNGSNSVSFLFRCFGEKDSFQYSCVFIQTPICFFLATIYGITNELDDLQIGKPIAVKNYSLPQFLLNLLIELENSMLESSKKLNKKQWDAIFNKIKKDTKG